MQPGRVDFYLLNQTEPDSKWLLACRLLEKAYQKGHHVIVLCSNAQEAEHLDELLWTFKEDSFIPHHLFGEGPTPPPPVQIGYDTIPTPHSRDILMNLSQNIPPCYIQFKRILEIVPCDDAGKAVSRQHYQHYRKAGWILNAHEMK